MRKTSTSTHPTSKQKADGDLTAMPEQKADQLVVEKALPIAIQLDTRVAANTHALIPPTTPPTPCPAETSHRAKATNHPRSISHLISSPHLIGEADNVRVRFRIGSVMDHRSLTQERPYMQKLRQQGNGQDLFEGGMDYLGMVGR